MKKHYYHKKQIKSALHAENFNENGNKLDSNTYSDLVLKRNTHPINLVSLGMSDIDGENVVLRDEEAIEKDGEIHFTL